MKLPLYRDALLDGWNLAIRHKLLWVYGLFAAFLGQMGVTEIILAAAAAGSTYALVPSWLALPKLLDLTRLFSYGVPLEFSMWMVWVLGVLTAFGILLLFLATVSQGALIASAAASARARGLPDADKAWHIGASHFWRLLGITIIRKCVIVALAVLVGWGTWNAAVAETTTVGDLMLFFAVFVLAVLVGMAVSFLSIYAAGYVVVEEYPLSAAVAAAWRLFLGHWMVSLEVGFIVMAANAALMAVAAVGLLALSLIAQLWEILAILTGQFMFFNVLFGVALAVYILFLVAMGSIFTVFSTTVWTHLFIKMHKHGLLSRMLHWLT